MRDLIAPTILPTTNFLSSSLPTTTSALLSPFFKITTALPVITANNVLKPFCYKKHNHKGVKNLDSILKTSGNKFVFNALYVISN